MSDPTDEMSRARTALLLHDAENAAALAHRLALLNIKTQHLIAAHRSHYDPNQPRVPAGHPDGGQWTKSDVEAGIRLAAGEGRGGKGGWLRAIVDLAMAVIEAYRSEKGLRDLFRNKIGTVSYTRFKGQDIFGSNSTSPLYTQGDRKEAGSMRGVLIKKYPGVMAQDNTGQMPNDALFHAETTVLLRASRENSGTLAGQTLEVFTDEAMCPSCEILLPYVGLELGNPTVTYIDRAGRVLTMKDGAWLK